MRTGLRIATLVLLAALSIHIGHAQQITSDVEISGAGLNDGYFHGGQCDSQGRLYRPKYGHREASAIMRIARDGTTQIFTLPDSDMGLNAFAPTPSGLLVLINSYSRKDGVTRTLIQFDDAARITSTRRVPIEFEPEAMAVTSAGKTIIVGYQKQGEAKKIVGEVLDVDDHVMQHFDFPPGSEIEKPFALRVQGGDDGAYLINDSAVGPIYSISESGHVNLFRAAPPAGAQFFTWTLNGNVAVEAYRLVSDPIPGPFRFDLYDAASGVKTNTMTVSRLPGFAIACYVGGEITVLGYGGPGSQALRLRSVKLEP
jgi:hypothetical protein